MVAVSASAGTVAGNARDAAPRGSDVSGPVFVTGAAGFLGAAMGRHWAARGAVVVGLDRVPLSAGRDASVKWAQFHVAELPWDDLGTVLRGLQPDLIIHCAGGADPSGSVAAPARDFKSGVPGAFSVLECVRTECPGARVVFMSSAAVYGQPSRLPVREVDETLPISPYGFHKLMCELLCREYSSIFGLRTACARVFSAYGPGLARQVVWQTCRRVLGQDAAVWTGTGDESRDYVHEDDVARAVDAIVRCGVMDGEAYNVATGQEVTVRELVALVRRIADRRLDPVFLGEATPGAPARWVADVSRLRALGFEAVVGLESGVGQVLERLSSQDGE